MRGRPFISKPIEYKVGGNGCYICTSHNPNGRGYPQYGKKNMHRYLYEERLGFVLPTKILVRHKCDNKMCINLSHLELGTVADNNRDRMNRGRSRPRMGEDHGSAKLTAAQAKEIRESTEKTSALVSRYGVCKSTIKYIRAGDLWKHDRSVA